MAGHKSWNEIRNKWTPEHRALVAKGVQKELKKMVLAELRKVAGLTQMELADSMGIKQPALSRLESEEDMQISTLRRIVEAIGGKLEIIVDLPSERVTLSQFSKTRGRAKRARAVAVK